MKAARQHEYGHQLIIDDVTLGHENAGTVAALGSGVTSVREGDAVAIFGSRFEVQFEATPWGTVKDLHQVHFVRPIEAA